MARYHLYDVRGNCYEDNRYGAPHMRAYRELRNETLNAIIASAFGAGAAARILEVGCGTGPSLEFLACLPARHRLFGMDASRTMLRQCAEKAATLDNPPRLLLGDSQRLPYLDNSFDMVFATRFIHQFPHELKRRLHSELLRVTRPSGVVAIEFYSRPYHWFRYYLGARKGRSKESFFRHYPTRQEVQEIVGARFRMHPVRVVGSRLLARVTGYGLQRTVTQSAARLSRGLLVDEYFVVARK